MIKIISFLALFILIIFGFKPEKRVIGCYETSSLGVYTCLKINKNGTYFKYGKNSLRSFYYIGTWELRNDTITFYPLRINTQDSIAAISEFYDLTTNDSLLEIKKIPILADALIFGNNFRILLPYEKSKVKKMESFYFSFSRNKQYFTSQKVEVKEDNQFKNVRVYLDLPPYPFYEFYPNRETWKMVYKNKELHEIQENINYQRTYRKSKANKLPIKEELIELKEMNEKNKYFGEKYEKYFVL